ncbi:hypothetical protein F5Y09DRAFT_299833 [Xylaria sp. FL1042]|nr:hypothetical protein F5Y09DRAFT_299833 [Xylaria sp. FL1042]
MGLLSLDSSTRFLNISLTHQISDIIQTFIVRIGYGKRYDSYMLPSRNALCTLEAIGYDPKTMIKRGIIWAKDQDPSDYITNTSTVHALLRQYSSIVLWKTMTNSSASRSITIS